MKKQKSKNKLYSTADNLYFVIKKTWHYDKGMLLSLLIKIPSLIALPLLTTYLSKVTVDLVEQDVKYSTIILAVVGVFICILFFRIINTYASSKLEWRSFSNRFNYIYLTSQKAMSTDYSNMESPNGQVMMRKALNAVNTPNTGIQQVFNQIASILSSILGLITYSVLLFTLKPWIPIYLLVLSSISYILQKQINNWHHRNKTNWVSLDRKLQYITNKSGDYTIGKDVKIYGMKMWLDNLFFSFFNERCIWFRKSEIINFLFAFLNILLAILRDGVAYIFLIYSISKATMSSGDFVLYFGIISQYSGWLFGVMSAMSSIYSTSLSLCDLREFLDMPDNFNLEKGCPLPSETCDITFENVCFSYSDDEKLTLKDIDFYIKKGEKIAIVGLNGAGKTTLVKLLCGLYRPTNGSIKINGLSVDEFNRDDYYTLFSVVFQDIVLLPLTIAKNIALCEESKIDYHKLENALKLSGLYKKVQRLPEKENTMLMKSLVENSIELSGGEQQKLALARAIYKNGNIIVLDEPTAALDPLAEDAMYQTYAKLTAGRTSIFISHRLSSTRFCDRIFYMENGQIVEEGTHDDLMSRGGKYAELFLVQSQYYKEDKTCSN